MITFKEFMTEQFLLEVLNSKFDVYHYPGFRDLVNQKSGDKIFPGHTAMMSSGHMSKHDLFVLRMMNKNREVEYHLINSKNPIGELPPEKQNNKALFHALKIIHDDSQSYIDKGHKIKLQAGTDEQHEKYTKLAPRMIKDRPDKKVVYYGKTERVDGNGLSHTLMIESDGYNPIDWRQYCTEEFDKEVAEITRLSNS